MDAGVQQSTMETGMSRRRFGRCALLTTGGVAAIASRGVPAFVSSIGQLASPRVAHEIGRGAAPVVATKTQQPSQESSWGSASTAAAFCLGAVAVERLVNRQSRDEEASGVAMFGGHDRRTFRGKLHAQSFGKYRIRKHKARKAKALRNGTWDPERAANNRGQPEPEHSYDMVNLLENPMYYYPPVWRRAFAAHFETVFDEHRKDWQRRMGKIGPQWAFKDWTPPAQEVAAALVGEKVSAQQVKELRQRSLAGIQDCQKALAESGGDMEKAMEWLKKKGIAKADKKAGNLAAEGNVASYVHFNNKLAVLVEVNSETDFVAQNAIFKEFAKDVAMQIAANPGVLCVKADGVPEEVRAKEREIEMAKEDLAGKPEEMKAKIVDGRLKKRWDEMTLMSQKWLKDEDKTVEQVLKEVIAKIGENIVIRRFERLNLGEGLQKKDTDFAAGVEKELAKYRTAGDEAPEEEKKEEKKEEPKAEKPKEEKKEAKPDVAVSAAQVKALRERSGAGILDSQKALKECNGDMDKAMDWLRKKGIAKADKKAGNLSAEGVIASYVHFNSRIGVIVEVNSETDFVAMNAIFKEFASDVAMQIAANPTVTCISSDEVPEDVKAKEKELEMSKEDLAGKPENMKEKIVEGRLKKRYDEMALLNQKWLKDEDKTVQEVLKEKIATIGENIVIRRFRRLTLGEGLEKKDTDFAAGVEKELAKYRQE